MNKAFLALLAATLLGCGSTDDGGQPGPVPFENTELETYELAVIPDLSTLAELNERPVKRFVMVNALVFKDEATGEGFEGLSGAEAYAIYIEGLTDAQMAIGSRLIWSGAVQAQVVGVSEPVFETIALLEYASPPVFLEFAKEPGDAPEARAAGLLGQWLVASTSIEEGGVAEPATPEPLPSAAEVARMTGLTEAQAERLLDGPADDPVFIVDFLRFSDGSGDAYQPYRDALKQAATAQGASVTWRGTADTYVIGSAGPAFEELIVTSYPNRAAYVNTLSDPAVLAASNARVDGLETHWVYTAGGSSGLEGIGGTAGGAGSSYQVCTLGLCMEDETLGASCLDVYNGCVDRGHYARSCRMDADKTCGVFGETGPY